MGHPVTILGQTVIWPTTGETGYGPATNQFVDLVSTAVAPISGLYNPAAPSLVGNLAINNLDELTFNGQVVQTIGSNVVTSFNTRTGAVTLTSGDVTGALGYTPVQSVSGTSGQILSTGGTTPVLSLATTGVTPGVYTYSTILVDSRGRITFATSGTPVTSFNTRTGNVTLTSADVTTALGYTPGSGSGTVTSITAGTGLTGGTITTTGTIALATTAVAAGSYTNANITVDAYGRITSASNGSAGGVTSFNTRTGAVTLTSSDVTTALGYTPGTGNGTVTSVSGTSGRISSTGGTTPVLDLATTTVAAGSYTNTNITVDAYGRITSASNGTGGGSSALSAITAATANNTISNSTYAQQWGFVPNATQYYGLKLKDETVGAGSGGYVLNVEGIAGNGNYPFSVSLGITEVLTVNGSGGLYSRANSTTGGYITLGAGASYATDTGITLDGTYAKLQTGGFDRLAINQAGAWILDGVTGTVGQTLLADAVGKPYWSSVSAGGVTAITATAPLASTGGATPDISISQATTTTAGYLSSTDWNTFNGKANSGANSDITSLSGLTGAITTPTYIDFALGATVTPAVGRLTWDSHDGTLQFGLLGGNVNLQIGQEQLMRIHNNTGSPLTDGQVVYVTGSSGNWPTVALAQANSEATSAGTIGIVTEPIANGAEGFVTTNGTIHNIDTATGGFADGDTIYLSPTVAGGFTKTKPTAPNHTVILGFVIRAHAVVGQLFVKVDNGYELQELHNVLITGTPTNGQALVYDTANSVWVNGDPAWQVPSVQTQTYSASPTIDWTRKDVTKIVLTGNATITNSGAVDGQKMILQVQQGGSGSYTVAFTSETKFGTDIPSITLSTAVGAIDMIGLQYSALNSKYNVVAFVKGF